VRFGRDAIIQAEDSTDNMTPNHLIGVPPLALVAAAASQAETRPTAGVRCLPSQLTPEQPAASLHLCAYCNNPVPNGKFVHQSCEDRHDEREEQADSVRRDDLTDGGSEGEW